MACDVNLVISIIEISQISEEYPWFTAFKADYVLGISIYMHAIVRSIGPPLDTSALRGENMKHSDCKKGTSTVEF